MAKTNSALKTAFAGKLPSEKPDYVDAWDWAVLVQHVNEGSTFSPLAEKFGTSPANVRRMATRAAHLINEREKLAPADWEQRFKKGGDHPPVIQVRPPIDVSKAKPAPAPSDLFPISTVTITEKRETQDARLVTLDFCGQPLTLNVPDRVFRNLGVGFTYPLALVATPIKEDTP